MKKNHVRSLLKTVLISTLIVGCNPLPKNQATLSGIITNNPEKTITIQYYNNDFLEGLEKEEVTIDEQGRFTVQLPVSHLKNFRVVLNSKSRIDVFLKPGWSTVINAEFNDQKKLDTLYFEGTGSLENDLYGKYNKSVYAFYSHMKKEPEPYLQALDSIETVMCNILESDPSVKGKMDPDMLFMMETEITYHKISRWMYYIKRNYTWQGKEESPFVVETNKTLTSLIDFSNPALLSSNFYNSILENYLEVLAGNKTDRKAIHEKFKDDRDKMMEAFYQAGLTNYLDVADSLITNDSIKSAAYYHHFLSNLELPALKTIKELYASRFVKVVTNPEKQALLSEKIANLEKLLPGNPAPTFAYPDSDGNMISLETFRGKYIYIDVWATWCGPCRGEVPHLKSLEEEYGDKIAFIGISLDDSKKKWNDYVAEKELKGAQIHTGAWECEITKSFQIKGIPRFIMIDPEGKIISADATRPSNPATKAKFNEWLNIEPSEEKSES